MEFRTLRLTGFKSFVEPTDFEIRPGLTGIVGPNGCGKSNLLEAMRWVMGATSAKALRAGGMEDVIFSGSGTGAGNGRPARSWAEVTLLVGNEDRTAPPAFNEHPTLEITRRITKKADGATSTYRINGKEVRAKDVQLLFADASSGANSPALVRQGQVSDLINAKPENRRKFLEEAAGITGLYARRHEAELRLKAASQNLERLEDVTGELAQQRGQLSQQARQASRYRNIAGHLKKAEALLAYSRVADATNAHAEATERLKGTGLSLEEAVKASASANAAKERAHDQVEPLRKREAEAAAALSRLQVEQETFDKDLTRAHEEIERRHKDRERLIQEIAREKDLGSDAAEALDALVQERGLLEGRADADEAALSDATREVEQLSVILRDAEAAADRDQRALSDAKAAHQAAAAAKARAEGAVRTTNTQVDRLEAEYQAAVDAPGHADDLAKAQADHAAAAGAAAEAARALTSLRDRRADTEGTLMRTEAPRDEARGRVRAVQGEVDTIRRILKASTPEGRGVIEDVTAEAGFEAALAAALEDGLEAPEDPQADRHWSEAGTRPVTDLPLPAHARALSDVVSAPAVLARRLSAIGIVDAADAPALAPTLAPGQALVSPEGDLWRWDGFVARAGAKTAAALRLEQKRELAALEASLEAAFARRDQAEEAYAAAKSRLVTIDEDVRKLQSAKDIADGQVLRLERLMADLRSTEDRRAARLEAVSQRLEDARTRAAAAKAELDQMSSETADLVPLDDLETALKRSLVARDQARQDNGRARGRRADMVRDVEARAARLKQIDESHAAWVRRAGTAADRIEQVHRTLTETEAAITLAEKVPGELLTRKEALYEAVTAAESRRRVAADALAEVQGALTDADRAVRATADAAAHAREDRARAEAQAEAAKERLDDVLLRAKDVHEGDAAELLAIAEHDPSLALPSQPVLEEKIDKLKREREALGSVNLRADQEMVEIDGRIEEIEREKADCEAAINKLRGAIGTLNKDGRARLLSAFDAVNVNFRTLFTELFGGGRAELRLVDSDDPLEAGLEIFASPPGKKLTSMSLMSGGEQALTATALIFAVFKSNPAPVCVLDEVDAPLDDANTDRFCTMLAKMAKDTNTRFIAITHHPLTMSRMDRLFGVTMIERGVSQLVSVDLAEAEKLAA